MGIVTQAITAQAQLSTLKITMMFTLLHQTPKEVAVQLVILVRLVVRPKRPVQLANIVREMV